MAYMLFLGVFAFFLYTSYTNSVEQAFVALDKSSGDCHEVPIAVSGTFLADRQGNWVNTPAFSYFQAAYAFTFSGLQVNSLAEYTAMMHTFRDNLKAVGSVSPNQNLAVNLIIWMAYLKRYSPAHPTMTDFSTIGYGQLQQMQLTGSATVIFDAQFYIGALADENGRCDIIPTTSFDPANGFMVQTYNASEYDLVPSCVRVSPPLNYGNRPLGVNDYTISLDVRSFAVAMAVNLGILTVSDLQKASAAVIPITFNNVNYLIGQYFDVRAPLMQSIYCLTNASEIPAGTFGVRNLCLLLAGTTLHCLCLII